MKNPFLSRDEAAEYLGARGLPVASNTLKKYVVTGGGPRFYRFGSRRVVYQPADLDAWADGRLCPVGGSADDDGAGGGIRSRIAARPRRAVL